jgi:ABC-type polysaccharide/polyol phosphate transport system ATPase subunit
MITSSGTKAISVANVSKSFPHHRSGLLREQLAAWIRGAHRKERFYALKNVSFEVSRGESVAVIGTNGSGKSTLLALLCGLTPPDDGGSISVHGQIAPLLDLGSGFHFDLTGAENLKLNASILGMSQKRTEESFDSIVEFSELGDFIYEPLRTYSTGMVMRLAFAIATHVEPDVLIIDEVLGVGDRNFQQKCFERIMTFRQSGNTLFVVSHSGATLKEICSRAIWLDHGNLLADGEIDMVLDLYEQAARSDQILALGRSH